MTGSLQVARLVEALVILNKALETSSEDDFLWSSWNSGESAQQEMQEVIAMLQKGGRNAFERVRLLIAPTGPLQEVALQAGWSDVFQAQAKRIEALLILI